MTLRTQKSAQEPQASAQCLANLKTQCVISYFPGQSAKLVAQLPDMDFPINAKAEGRVLVPWEHRKYPNMTRQDSSGELLHRSFQIRRS
jgi:hypothetical protein